MSAVRDSTGRQVLDDARTAAFTALYDEHCSDIYRYVHRRCQDVAMAEDVTQDTFLTAVRTVDDPASINAGWLKRVARNRLVDLLRRQTNHRTKLRLIRSGHTDRIETDVIVEHLRVAEALSRLKITQRLALTLHYIDGLTVSQLAAELGRSPKGVEALLTRARRRLREELEATND